MCEMSFWLEKEGVMAWRIRAKYYEACNCAYGCPCNMSGFRRASGVALVLGGAAVALQPALLPGMA